MAKLGDVERKIETGDLLLWRPGPADFFGAAISGASQGQYAHVGMAVWLQQPFAAWQLFSLDMLAGQGGVMQPLTGMVRRWRGLCSVFGANSGDRWPKWNGRAAARYFIDHFVGGEYGVAMAQRAAWRELPILRWFLRPNRDDAAGLDGPPMCAAAVAASCRLGGGVDVVRNLADDSVWPGDFAESPFCELKYKELV